MREYQQGKAQQGSRYYHTSPPDCCIVLSGQTKPDQTPRQTTTCGGQRQGKTQQGRDHRAATDRDTVPHATMPCRNNDIVSIASSKPDTGKVSYPAPALLTIKQAFFLAVDLVKRVYTLLYREKYELGYI